MNKLLTILILTALLASCDLPLNNEKKAIEICQKSKVQFQSDNAIANAFLNAYGLGINATWLDFANMIAKKDPNKKYEWHAKNTADNKYYIVDFTDPDGWGHRWEVDIEQHIVKSINQNDYLTRKYGLSRLDGKNEFEVTEVTRRGLEFDKHYSYNDNSNSSDISYVIKASVLNKTTKTIISAAIEGSLKLIFQDKTVTGESNSESGFRSGISENKPWEPNTTREFYIKTMGIKKIYLNYIPEYVVFDISLKAEDPAGFTFDKDIADMDLKENWKSLNQPSKTTKSNGSPNLNSTDVERSYQNEYNSKGKLENFYDIGSSKELVLKIQGTPTSTNAMGNTEVWDYGISSVTFQDGKLESYSNIGHNLKIHMKILPSLNSNDGDSAYQNGYDSKGKPVNFYDIGSSKELVLKLQGTPTSTNTIGDTEVWDYGISSVTFQDGKLESYSNLGHNLKIRMKK